MIVRSYGISIEQGNAAVSISDLFESLEQTSGQLNPLFNSPRLIFVSTTQDADFYTGLVVTVKDQKTFCELVAGTLTINVVQLQNNMMEFNFFVVNKTNGLGIYQHYHQSCSPGSFAQYLKERYRVLTDQSRNAALQSATTGGVLRRKDEKRIRSEHSGSLKLGTLVHRQSLATVLSAFHRIKAFEYELAEVESPVTAGVPVASYAVREYKRFTFGETPVRAVARAIQSTVDTLGITKGHVNVVDVIDDEEVPMSVKLSNIPENFGEHDFDQIAGQLNDMVASEFATHSIISQLLDICKGQHQATFMQSVRTGRR